MPRNRCSVKSEGAPASSKAYWIRLGGENGRRFPRQRFQVEGGVTALAACEKGATKATVSYDDMMPGATVPHGIAQVPLADGGGEGAIPVGIFATRCNVPSDAQRTLFEAREQDIEAVATYHKAVAEAERLIGGALAPGTGLAGPPSNWSTAMRYQPMEDVSGAMASHPEQRHTVRHRRPLLPLIAAALVGAVVGAAGMSYVRTTDEGLSALAYLLGAASETQPAHRQPAHATRY